MKRTSNNYSIRKNSAKTLSIQLLKDPAVVGKGPSTVR